MDHNEEYRTFGRLAAYHLREAQGAMLNQVKAIEAMISEVEKELPKAPDKEHSNA